jgi:HK97 gp10 family phage protein
MPNGSRGPVEFSADVQQMRNLALHLKEAGEKDLRKELTAALRKAANPVAAEARANASEVSKKVAASITIRSSFTAKRTGVFITANASKMPPGHEALPGLLEKGSKGNPSLIRHPVFGTGAWATQPAHPFLAPAVDAHAEQVAAEVDSMVDDLFRRAGLT